MYENWSFQFACLILLRSLRPVRVCIVFLWQFVSYKRFVCFFSGPIWSQQRKRRKRESLDRRQLEPSELRMFEYSVHTLDCLTELQGWRFTLQTLSCSVSVWIRRKLGYLVCIITEGQFVLRLQQSRPHTHTISLLLSRCIPLVNSTITGIKTVTSQEFIDIYCH